MTLEQLFAKTPAALLEMENEFIRVGSSFFKDDPFSQSAASLMLAIRGTSILLTIGNVLRIDSFDQFDVLLRAFMETRDLLSTFRFDNDAARLRVTKWFKGKDKESWKADHHACEKMFTDAGIVDLHLSRSWGIFSSLSHPTYLATTNSVAVREARFSVKKLQELQPILEEKIADYITAISSLLVCVIFQFDGCISLECDKSKMPTAIEIHETAGPIVKPFLGRSQAAERAKAKG